MYFYISVHVIQVHAFNKHEITEVNTCESIVSRLRYMHIHVCCKMKL